MTLWLDVDDLFFYARHSSRPSGIQRLSCETYIAMMQIAPSEVKFVIYDPKAATFRVVEWEDVARIYASIRSGRPASAEPGIAVDTLPPQNAIASFFRKLTGSPAPPPLKSHAPFVDLVDQAQPGDILCALGAPWHHAAYAEFLTKILSRTKMRFALLVHDLIPLLCPEFFEAGRAPHFEKVLLETLPLADTLMTNSRSTARDVLRWAADKGLSLKATPQAIPIGTGFSRPPPGVLPAGLEHRGYVLFVSTIEIRKNHLQAFRVWCRMLREMPRDQVPTLVFAGNLGWMVSDLMKAIENTNYLDGKLMLVKGPDDATLSALYQGCLFTLFPSYYEGLGLPVSDSLSFGKLCVSSNRTSMPEVGGDYCLYVDPDNNDDAYGVVRRIIETPSQITSLENRIKADFRPILWTDTARAVLAAVASTNATSDALTSADKIP